ncbi:type II secretory pathway pseudopilin PulG [Microbacterium sp. BE35]|uniref:type IV pilus modification PilV family protein n=1 Tax=Microbacterium sp. BE35 TaxID=2817773 RepID=UPI0028643605|nr:type II secretion system protein [Microbacterium sp. BE35]MDR7190287.1 type II secretory pathway pseudopilin PulG [Microbacterium sp. BE35]
MIEIIIGMILLAIIAVAILPALWQGIQYSSQQSATATATRELNSLIEGIRENPDCGQIGTATSAHTFTDGSGATITSAGSYSACPATSRTVTISLTATDAGGYVLATLKAIVYVP